MLRKINTKRLVQRCPMCSGELAISRLSCRHCDTQIESLVSLPPFFKLPQDLQDFVMIFLRCRGNIRDVERELGISYPTVCKRLDAVNELLGNKTAQPVNRHEVLSRLERGEITASEAAQQMLKGGTG